MSVRRIAVSVLFVAILPACSQQPRPPAAASVAPAPTEARTSAAGSDPITPGLGNDGYDVQHYDLDLRITPKAQPLLAANETITAEATKPLSQLGLDLTGLDVGKVTVNGKRAKYRRTPGKLLVTPAKQIAKGPFKVGVEYSGTPASVNDKLLGRYGWISTDDGVFVGDEPDAAHTWFASNDVPEDKASFGFRVTVPDGLTAVANGEQTGTSRDGQTVTYTWQAKDPMATYLAMVDVGRFKVRTGRTQGGVPVYVAVDPKVVPAGPDALYNQTVKVTDAWSQLFGPYPFTSTGGVIDNVPIQFALETQTKPEYIAGMGAVPTVVAHELSHQWFGDSVSLERWSDIWLNEGFATYAEWLWGERQDPSETVQAQFDRRYRVQDNTDMWKVAPGKPDRSQLFGRSVYERGAMTLHALRGKVGDQRFFEILRTWTTEHRHGNATTADFIALAERVSGLDLRHFFQVWLYDQNRPVTW